MHLRTLAASTAAHPNVTKMTTWSRDIFTGAAEALLAAGLVSQADLKPQQGRPDGLTAFLPDGTPCPPSRRAWREPGFRSLRRLGDGTYRLEVTIPKETQAWRRKAKKAQEHELEQQRMDAALAECGPKYRNWTLKHGYTSDPSGATSHTCYEWWEGTKEQLQAEGIGGGMVFPGEPGGPRELHCKCPLGFDVRVHLPGSSYAPGKAAAHIYTAQSWYVEPRSSEKAEYVQHAPGVVRQVWRPSGFWNRQDLYCGSDTALVAAGLVPSVELFPGQPGRNRMQASYTVEWKPADGSSHREVAATIRKRGKGNQFWLEILVSEAEKERRNALSKQHDHEKSERARVLAAERKLLREAARPQKAKEEFRASRLLLAELSLKLLWNEVFGKGEGAISFDIPEGSELWDDLAEAFQTIRDVVREADIVRDKKVEAAAQERFKLVAARNDIGLQTLLRQAKGLRLVHSAPDEEQG